MEESGRYLMNTYSRMPIVLRKGRGMKVWSSDGKEYLDFLGGIAVNSLGHCHPNVVIALQKQAQRLLHVSNLYHIESQIELAKILVNNSFADKAFFCNSGTEAIEGAIKLARKYAADNGFSGRFEIITAYGSFHGRTFGSLSATGQDKLKKGFEPLVPGFKHVPFNDIEALEKAVTNNTCAVLLEPIQGEGGIKIPSDDYLEKVRELCDRNGTLLILDEIQTGTGRTGTLFAYEQYGIEPDIMALAKGLGGGAPIGAILANDSVAASFQPGSHGSTFGGNPLVCAAAQAVLETLLDDTFILDNCKHTGKYFMECLDKLKKEFPETISEVRGKGLMIGLELTKEGAYAVEQCAKKGILINCTAGSVLRFTPPLIASEEDVDLLIDTLKDVL